MAPGSWAEVTVHRDGRTVARLPYVLRRRGPLRVLTQPPFTQTLGPWVAKQPGAKRAKVIADELELMSALEASLPPAHAFRQSFSPTMLNALPFYWAGYRLEVRYTYQIEGLASESALWAGLSGNVRREINKARKRVEVRDDMGIDRFRETWVKTFQRQGLAGSGAPDFSHLDRIEAACAPRDARAMLFATDATDRVHAVAYVIWDRHAAYYLLGGGDPALRTSGAGSLLMWEAIMRARQRTDLFDFEGSMIRSVERFFRAFGGRQVPYLYVSRTSRTAQAAFAAWDQLRRLGAGLRPGGFVELLERS
jgi:Acetyltransferase (GNAT) domain